MPSDSRLTPAARKPAKLSRSKVPGFASSVTSASGSSGTRARMPATQRVDRRGGKHARRAAADEHRHHLAAPDRRQRELEVGEQRVDVAFGFGVAANFVGIEVAVRALLQAPRDVHVQRQRRQRGEARLRRRRGGHCNWRNGFHSSAQALEQRAQRLAAVRDEVLLRERQLGAGEPRRLVEEMRVVAEAAGAARRVDDAAVPRALGDHRLGIRRRGAPAPARRRNARGGRRRRRVRR